MKEKDINKATKVSEKTEPGFSQQRRAIVTGMLGGLAAAGTGMLGFGTAQAQEATAEKPLAGKVAPS
ncbi:MAG: hypothetical protein ACRCYY_17030 [Trueperaceae bacterium]